jgi:hypothetical protein
MTEPSDSYTSVGAYPLHEATRITELLDAGDIDYEVEIDDSEIKNMSIVTIAVRGGTAGLGCKMRIFVKNTQIEEANAILRKMFPV